MSYRSESATALKCDLLVVGSGAGGLAAAVTASVAGLAVIVVEKEPVFGGASARSGGGLWIPDNGVAREAGIEDSRTAAETYIRLRAGDRYDPARVAAFLDEGPKMVRFLQEHRIVEFRLRQGQPDYYPDERGAAKSGRTILAAAVDARTLGQDLQRLREPLADAKFLGLQLGGEDLARFMTAGHNLRSFLYVCARYLRLIPELLVHGRSMRLVGGNALVAGLAAGALAHGAQIRTSAAARSLICEEGRVRGAWVDCSGQSLRIEASRGVVLATGGFPHDSARRAALFPAGAKTSVPWGVMPYGNAGDGLALGEAAGGYVEDRMPMPIALGPIMRTHVGEGRFGAFPIFSTRGAPGCIAVTPNGKRFVNEASSYHVFARALLAACPDRSDAVGYVICDHRALRRYGLGRAFPFPVPIGRHVRSSELIRGRTVRELAMAAGIDPTTLEATVTEYNRHARHGEDPEFGRGTNAYDIAHGDPSSRPNPNVGPLERSPYYAVRVHAGALATFAGLMTNESAQVIKRDGTAIPGLYAAGNDLSSITGGDYIGGGCTLGPAMTFGYIAAKHASALRDR